MGASEEGMRDILEVKERIAEKIARHEEEIEFLRKNLDALDSMIRQSSFARASELRAAGGAADGGGGAPEGGGPSGGGGPEPIPITAGGGGGVIANAYVTPERVSVVVSDGVSLDPEAAPLKSFFLGTVIGRMREQDEGGDGPAVECAVDSEGGAVRGITVTNYRLPGRADEIVGAAKWALARMAAGSQG